MGLFNFLSTDDTPQGEYPPFIREVSDVRGVRIVRLTGPVGVEIGPHFGAADDPAAQPDVFTRPLLIDFKDATSTDFATVAMLVRTVRNRVTANVPVGIINAPAQLLAELEIAKVEDLLGIYDSEHEALAALATS